jgi:hypothetical protein
MGHERFTPRWFAFFGMGLILLSVNLALRVESVVLLGVFVWALMQNWDARVQGCFGVGVVTIGIFELIVHVTIGLPKWHKVAWMGMHLRDELGLVGSRWVLPIVAIVSIGFSRWADLRVSHRMMLKLILVWAMGIMAFPCASNEHGMIPRIAMLELAVVMAAGIVVVRYTGLWMAHPALFLAMTASWIMRYKFKPPLFDFFFSMSASAE